MKLLSVLILCALLAPGCARVKVGGTKEPIKIDVSMRVDIYQHIQNDIDAIEDIVSGTGSEAASADKHSMLNFFIGSAFAEEALDPSVKEAALRRKERLASLQALMAKGAIGENKSGLLEVVDAGVGDASVQTMVNAENGDRMVIYQALAAKNNTALSEIQKMYASRLQNDAPSGTPVEVVNASSGASEWQRK